jgi:hypothetical protein
VLQESIAYWKCCGTPAASVWYDRLLPYAAYGTALIALGALLTAIVAIVTQTRVARRRAAIDFFLKTDLDEKMLEAHREFEEALKRLKAHLTAGGAVKDFAETNEDTYRQIWKYLNVHELVAVGIRRKVFDRNVCYNFWGDALIRHAKETEAVIAYEIEAGAPSAYLELRQLSVKWARRAQKWREKLAKQKRR